MIRPTTTAVMQIVAAILASNRIKATVEYPGFIAIDIDDSLALHCGDNGDVWACDVVTRGDGECVESMEADHRVPRGSSDADVIASFIISSLAKAKEAAA